MPEILERLTKKQRKSLAHKERGRVKRALAAAADLETNGVPTAEGTDYVEEEFIPLSVNDQDALIPLATSKKPTPKKRKPDKLNSDATDVTTRTSKKVKIQTQPEQPPKSKTATAAKKAGKRYIIFVGNLSYKTSSESIARHFTLSVPTTGHDDSSEQPETSEAPRVRLNTKKVAEKDAKKATSKGCAFIEYSNANSLQRALALHGSILDGRKIRVEMTVGGGGKSEKRTQKLKVKNKKVAERRYTAASKALAESKGDDTQPDRQAQAPEGSTKSRRPPSDRSQRPRKPPPFVSGTNQLPATRKWGGGSEARAAA